MAAKKSTLRRVGDAAKGLVTTVGKAAEVHVVQPVGKALGVSSNGKPGPVKKAAKKVTKPVAKAARTAAKATAKAGARVTTAAKKAAPKAASKKSGGSKGAK